VQEIAGVIFTKGDTRKLFLALNAEVLVHKLRSTLKGTGFDPLTMAHVIQNDVDEFTNSKKMVTLKNTADIEAFVAKNGEKDPEIIASRMAVLSFYGGYSNFDDIYTSLTNLVTNNTE
jgi:ATP-dependent protease ClpP protease subunit